MLSKLEKPQVLFYSLTTGRACFSLLSFLFLFPLFSCCGLAGQQESAEASLMNPSDKTDYDSAEDPFYRKNPIHVTWIMIWNGSTEKHWWKPSDYHGCKVQVNGSWQSIDWNDKKHIDTYCESIRKAGIDVIVADFTNGFRWEWQAKRVQRFCHENGMKFAVAFNPQDGSRMESGCKKIWDVYASGGSPISKAYFRKDGKPLVVLYTWRKGYENSISLKGTYRGRFSTVWASGEDSDKNKWGWQLEPKIGPVASKDAVFVTGSVKFGSPKTKEDEWRKHLSWLDYGFVIAKRSNPKYLIIGSFDDVDERNAWMIVDTKEAAKGWQMRDKGGAISQDIYYKRVSEWLKGKPTTVEGGLIPDGAYLMQCENGNVLGVTQNRRAQSLAMLKPYSESIENFIWFYHLGENVYRLVKLNAGLPLESTKSKVLLNWDSEAATQRWILEKNDRGYRLLNKASGKCLTYTNTNVITEAPDDASASQYWSLIKAAVVSESKDNREQSTEGDGLKPAP